MKVLNCIAVAALILLIAISVATAEDKGMYPSGRSVTAAGSDVPLSVLVSPSTRFINEAPQAYFKVYGAWPETFQAIIDAGLIRVNLTIEGSYVITPDDGELNHEFDVMYIYNGPDTPPQIAKGGIARLSKEAQQNPDARKMLENLPQSTTAFSLPALTERDVYAMQGSARLEYGHVSPETNEGILRYGGHLGVQKLVAIAHMCMIGSVDYMKVYGDFPDNWNEFVDTGFCPVTSDMLNPVTGEAFAADGSAYSFDFVRHDDGGFHVRVLDENGVGVRLN